MSSALSSAEPNQPRKWSGARSRTSLSKRAGSRGASIQATNFEALLPGSTEQRISRPERGGQQERERERRDGRSSESSGLPLSSGWRLGCSGCSAGAGSRRRFFFLPWRAVGAPAEHAEAEEEEARGTIGAIVCRPRGPDALALRRGERGEGGGTNLIPGVLVQEYK
eukprot:scaffold266779_cov31-Tisochrysis_lutea.AAC.5